MWPRRALVTRKRPVAWGDVLAGGGCQVPVTSYQLELQVTLLQEGLTPKLAEDGRSRISSR